MFLQKQDRHYTFSVPLVRVHLYLGTRAKAEWLCSTVPRPDVSTCRKYTLLAGTSGAVCQPARPWSFRAAQVCVVRKARFFQYDAEVTNSLLSTNSNQWHSPLAWFILGFQLLNFLKTRTKQLTAWYTIFLDRVKKKKLTAFYENPFNIVFRSSVAGLQSDKEHILHPQSPVL